MTYEDIPFDHLTCHAGSHFTASWNCEDVDGVPFDFIFNPGWVARMEVRDATDLLVTRFHSDPAKNGALPDFWPGTFSFDAIGNVTADLTSANTVGLPAGVHNFDLELLDPSDSEPRVHVRGRFRIDPEVTTNA